MDKYDDDYDDEEKPAAISLPTSPDRPKEDAPMSGATYKWMAGVAVAVALAGCGNEQCAQLGEHMADVVLKEAEAAGNEVAKDKRAEIVKKTTDACNAAPPAEDHLACALKAESTKAMKKCEGVDEDAKKD